MRPAPSERPADDAMHESDLLDDDAPGEARALQHFPPTDAAARARLAAVRPGEYARTRNHLEGAVTQLSPYLTHGLLSLPQVLHGVLQRHGRELDVHHKFVYELGWRAFFHHVWAHRGAGILQSLHEGPLPDTAYAREVPADVRAGCTGVPVIDQAVRTLYATGWLHNHARMWLASYLVHLRQVHWRAGADWLYGHLLDGDLASNHLSWQWVAGTGSRKPYLFNAENVARYAPPAWHSPGTVVDADYALLDRVARQPAPQPPMVRAAVNAGAALVEPALLHEPPAGLFDAPAADTLRGRAVRLVHPWSLSAPAADDGRFRIGIVVAEFHRDWPWREARWRFVAARMREVCTQVWWGDAACLQAALAKADSVSGCADLHLRSSLPGAWDAWLQETPAALFVEPGSLCTSFSQYWRRVTRGVLRAEELLKPR
jgi:deoxyribodipyrimidine photo-lyase